MFYLMTYVLYRSGEDICESESFDCDEVNPCSPEPCIPGKNYYPAHEITQFIQCGAGAQCFVQNCAPGTKWDDTLQTCVHL